MPYLICKQASKVMTFRQKNSIYVTNEKHYKNVCQIVHDLTWQLFELILRQVP